MISVQLCPQGFIYNMGWIFKYTKKNKIGSEKLLCSRHSIYLFVF